ncbi:hypothetical protein, partial [Micromonospora sp. MH33]|uniref:hypothetical protein n=1 Tax=Micromonospora sp. MH33 TaxID=1945509 RepID=UPI0011B27C4A
MAVVFDPAAETVVRLSPYDSDLKDSHNVYVSTDGTDGRITQLHWLAGLPSRAYGHELKHFAGVPHHASPGDLLRGSRREGDDHLNEPGFTAWELEQIRETAASYVAPTVAPRPVGSPESDSASSGSDVGSSERVSGSLPGRPAAMEWHPPADADADAGGQPSESAEYYDPYGLGREFADLGWAADPLGIAADPYAGMDMATPANGSEWSPQDFDERVIAATTRLGHAAYYVEAQFDEWVRGVFDISRAEGGRATNAFYRSLLNTPELLTMPGVTNVVGLRAWAARKLADDLARGEQSTFKEILPYPEGVSEQQRQALHRIWLDKLSNAGSGDHELAYVIPHIFAGGLGKPMRVHHPFDAPEDIGPTPDAGATRQQVVFWKGAYHLLRPRDPADSRLGSGFQQTAVPANVKEKLDAFFNDVIALLKDGIAAAEANLVGRHGHFLKRTFHRNLAHIRRQPEHPPGLGLGAPVSLDRQVRELIEHRRYFNSLQEDSGWRDESPRLESPFTLRLTASEAGGPSRRTSLFLQVGGKNGPVLDTTQIVAPGDVVAIDFGKVDGGGVGIARIPYSAAAGDVIYRVLDRRFTDSELAELRKRASARVWEFHKPLFSDSFQMSTNLYRDSGVLGIKFRAGDDEARATKSLVIPRGAAKVADGSSFVVPQDMTNVVLELGYDTDGRPVAVVEIPAEKNGGQALYWELAAVPTVRDIEWHRRNSFWELWDRWDLAEGISLDETLNKHARIPKPVDLQLSGPGRTIDGWEVDLSEGAEITLRVGRWPVGPDGVNSVFMVAKVPLKPLDDAAKAAYRVANPWVVDVPTHAYRLVNTGKTFAEFDTFKAQLQARKDKLDRRRKRDEQAAGRTARRRRIGDESSLPGGPAAFEWNGAASADGGVGSSSEWAAGVEPSVVWVDGGWRVSYRSAGG